MQSSYINKAVLWVALFLLIFKLFFMVRKKKIVDAETLIFDRCKNAGFPLVLCNLIVAQSKHETGNYTSRQFVFNNNAFGYGRILGDPDQIGSGGKHPEDSGVYAKYESLDKCMNDIIQYYTKRKTMFFRVKTAAEFAQLLRDYRYYTDNVANYTRAIVRHLLTSKNRYDV
jgi:hypothetical protein